jgi:hypothetical protein
MNIQLSMLACAAALAASMPASYAGPCSSEITRIQGLIDAIHRTRAEAGPTATESTAATRHRQPTPSSIAAAQAELGQTSPEKVNAAKAAMALALQADAAGDQSACEQALADVKQILDSEGTQTDDARR